MKRKVKKFAGDEGSVVRTRSDKEFEEDSKNPYGRPKTKEYTLDEVKEKISGLFGGKKEDTSKFDELESVGGSGRRARTIEEQIKGRPGREIEGKEFAPYRRTPEPEKGSTLKPEPAPSKGGTTYTNEEAINRVDAKPKKEVAPKKAVGEDAKPLPGVLKDKSKSQNLPGKPERKKEPTPYKDVVKSEDVGSQSFASKSEKKESEAKTRAGTTARTPEVKTGTARTRAGTVVKSSDEPSAEAKTKAMSSLAAKIKKQDEENRFNFSPSKSPNRSYKSGGSVSSASSRGDGIAQRGKTKGKIY